MKRIAVLTSGGDAPGMNAAIRAVARQGIVHGYDVLGVERGYTGLVEGKFRPLGRRDVSGIMQFGGTLLGSSRLPDFEKKAVRGKALKKLADRSIDALVVIGGNGSQTGAHALFTDGFPVVGVASTIDNDLVGSDPTIGVDTALDVALETIDRIKTTASSHRRAFLVETMGRRCGYLAVVAAITGGAEAVVVPEYETTPEAVARELKDAYERGKAHAIVVVAEGATYNAAKLEAWFSEHEEKTGFGIRTTKLGYVQRGGCPGAFDRLLGTRLGAAAADLVKAGEFGRLVGILKDEVTSTPHSEIVGKTKPVPPELFELARVMAE